MPACRRRSASPLPRRVRPVPPPQVPTSAGPKASRTPPCRRPPRRSAPARPGGIGSFFSNLFGPTDQQPAAAPPPQPAPSAAVVTPAQPQGKQGARPQRQAAAEAPAVTGSIKPATDKGNFAIQLAAVAEEDKAIAEADRLAKKYGADLGGRSPQLMIVPTNDGGTLYKIVAAPFETRNDGIAACEFLKAKGLSCMVITKK